MVQGGYYKQHTGRSFTAGEGLPVVSTDLDAVRAYGFEVIFRGLPEEVDVEGAGLTLAAKQVTTVGLTNDPVEVKRINDTLFYPGQTTKEDCVITFDNLYVKRTAEGLWKWFQNIYDPMTGELTKGTAPGGGNVVGKFKALSMDIIMLDNALTPHSVCQLLGVWPSSFRLGEFNSSTNEMHVIEVTFKYDFLNFSKYA